MSRFQTRVGATDTSNFINVAALSQEGRNRTQDRQLETQRLRSEIVDRTNQNKLDANQQAIQLYAIQQENEQNLRDLALRMQGLQANILQGRQGDLTTRRGQDIDQQLGQGQLDVQSEGLDVQREGIQARVADNALDRVARADLQGAELASRESEGAATRATQERVASAAQAGQDRRLESTIEADAENTAARLGTELAIAREGNEEAYRRLETQLNAEQERDYNKFLNDANLLGIQHSFDMEKLNRQIEAEPIDPEIRGALIEASNNIEELDLQNLSILAQVAGAQGDRVDAIAKQLVDRKLLHELEKQYNDSNIPFVENLSHGEAAELFQSILPYASPEAQNAIDEATYGFLEGSTRARQISSLSYDPNAVEAMKKLRNVIVGR